MGLTERKPRPGNAPDRAAMATWQDSLRAAFFDAVGPEDITEIVKKQIEKAKKGDIAAARFVLNYAVGSPAVKVKNAVIVASGVTNGTVAQAPHQAELEEPTLEISESLAGIPPEREARLTEMARRAARGEPLMDGLTNGYKQ